MKTGTRRIRSTPRLVSVFLLVSCSCKTAARSLFTTRSEEVTREELRASKEGFPGETRMRVNKKKKWDYFQECCETVNYGVLRKWETHRLVSWSSWREVFNEKNRSSGSSLDVFQTISCFCFVVASWIRQPGKFFFPLYSCTCKVHYIFWCVFIGITSQFEDKDDLKSPFLSNSCSRKMLTNLILWTFVNRKQASCFYACCKVKHYSKPLPTMCPLWDNFKDIWKGCAIYRQ